MGINREFRTICWTPDGRHIRSRPVKTSESIGENDICLDICKWLSILVLSHKAEKPLDLPCSTLTNLTLVGVKRTRNAVCNIFVFQKRFSISVNANLKKETLFIFFILKNALFQKVFGLAWRSLSACRHSCCVRYKSWNIDVFFSQQTYVNLSQYDNRLYANEDDLIEEEQDEVKSRSATQF